MASRATEMRSPADSRMSISRAGASVVRAAAWSRSSSVVSPIAETTTTTVLPAWRVATMRRATRRIASTSLTDEPPYFWTTSAIRRSSGPGISACLASGAPRRCGRPGRGFRGWSRRRAAPTTTWLGQAYGAPCCRHITRPAAPSPPARRGPRFATPVQAPRPPALAPHTRPATTLRPNLHNRPGAASFLKFRSKCGGPAPPPDRAGQSSTRRRPSKARPRVTSSAYSRSAPTGRPEASRETGTAMVRSMRVR